MASLLNSHPEIVLPAHENKLIVESGGLRDLVNQLSAIYDMNRHHYAVSNFVGRVLKFRNFGFRDPDLDQQVQSLIQTSGANYHKASEMVARQNPAADLSIHGIAHGFDFDHYDKCALAFVKRLCMSVVDDGILMAEGLVKPFVIPKNLNRHEILEECRLFLRDLYEEPVRLKNATTWCDDTPSNWLYLDFILELYPHMKFIHMIRDPRDVVGSYVGQVWAPSDPNVIIAIFKAQFAGYEALKARIPTANLIEIRIEDMIADLRAVMDRLSGFLGVENRFNLDLFQNEQTNAGSHADRIGADSVALIETELADWMRRQRYLASPDRGADGPKSLAPVI